MRRASLVTLLLLLGLSPGARAAEFGDFGRLSDPDRAWSFGWSIDISGSTLAVGNNNKTAGGVWIFERRRAHSHRWKLAKRLSSPTPEDAGYFGRQVTLDGDTLVVSVGFSDSVLIFERDRGGPGSWGFVKKLEIFGEAAIDGDLLAISEDGDRVRIFQRDLGGPDNWGPLAVVRARDKRRQWAYAVGLSGRTLVVGGARSGCGGFGDVCSKGYRIFEQDAIDPTVWRQVFRVPGGGFGDITGLEIFVDGSILLSTDGIRERSRRRWPLVGPLVAAGRFFGRDLRQETAAGWSSFPNDDILVYERTGDAEPNWSRVATVTPSSNCNELRLGPRELVVACPHGDYGTVRVYPRRALLKRGFEEADLAGWARQRGNVRLTAPGLGGSLQALAVDLDGRRTRSFVRAELADGEPSVSLSLLVRPEAVRLDGRTVEFVRLSGGGELQVKLTLREAGGDFTVELWSQRRSGEITLVGATRIPAEATRRIGIEWERATGPRAHDGVVRLLDRSGVVAERDDLDNPRMTIGALTLGLPAGSLGAESGTLVFDGVSLHR